MAEHEEKNEGEEGKPAKKSPMMLIIIVVAVVLAGGGGYFFMSKSKAKVAAPEEAADAADAGHGEAAPAKAEHGEAKGGHGKEGEKGDKGAGGVIKPLETFIVNLADPTRPRYLKITIQLEMDKAETDAEVTSKMPQIRDSLIILLSSKTLEEISTAEGKYQMRDEILARINQFMKKGKVVGAYFTDLVVQ